MIGFFEFFGENVNEYWSALWTMLSLALVSFAIAVVVGVVIAGFRVSPVGPLRTFASGYTSFFRNTPLLALYFLAFFGLPALGLVFSPFVTATVVLGLYSGAYMGETVRSGINSVDKGQAEAARAIGLNFTEVLSQVVMPQALRAVIPPVSNLFIANAKNVTVAVVIGVAELTGVSRGLANNTGQPLYAFLVASVFYVVFLLGAQQLFNLLETRLEIQR